MAMLKPSGPLTPIGDDFPVKPSDIDTLGSWHPFRNNRADYAALRIVRACDGIADKWLSFGDDSFGELDAWLIRDDEGLQISREFVERCLAASPAKGT